MQFLTSAITDVRVLSLLSVLLRPFVASLLGGIIGIEREIKNRPAGLRTYMLVSLGACIVMMINQYAYQTYQTGDLMRLGAQVVSGIGFLGAGTIIVIAHNRIKGLTTAAGLWTSAGIGLAVGLGLYEVALIGAAMVFLIFTILHKWDNYLHRNSKTVNVYVELSRKNALGEFLTYAREHDIETNNTQIKAEEDLLVFTASLKALKQQSREEMLDTMRKMDDICCIEKL